MHVYFSGIGGSAISGLALMAKQAGYDVSGSDARPSEYLNYLKERGVTNTHVGVDSDFIAEVQASKKIDWFVYGSAQPMDFPDHPEFEFCREHGIKMSKRDEFLNQLLNEQGLKLIAIAGTHGKTTTTAMTVWLFHELGIPISYSVGAKLKFGDASHLDNASQYFIYEADEYDRNFLAFKPFMSLISGVDWDHPDIYPTRKDYYQAFREYIAQSEYTVIWHADATELQLDDQDNILLLHDDDKDAKNLSLVGEVNRRNAWLVAKAVYELVDKPLAELLQILNRFPGLARRFELIASGIYSDYAHTPPKIRGALQMANEQFGDKVVVIYEGLHNLRQHFIKDDLKNLFDGVKELYVVPSYLAREDPNLPTLSPNDIKNLLSPKTQAITTVATLDDNLKLAIERHIKSGNVILALTAGGAGSLDEWLRQRFGG